MQPPQLRELQRRRRHLRRVQRQYCLDRYRRRYRLPPEGFASVHGRRHLHQRRACQGTCCSTDYAGCAVCSTSTPQTECALLSITSIFIYGPGVFPPAGGAATFTITGSNLGPSGGASTSNVHAMSFGLTGNELSIDDASTGCAVNAPGTVVACTSVTIPAGQGAGLYLAVAVVGRRARPSRSALPDGDLVRVSVQHQRRRAVDVCGGFLQHLIHRLRVRRPGRRRRARASGERRLVRVRRG